MGCFVGRLCGGGSRAQAVEGSNWESCVLSCILRLLRGGASGLFFFGLGMLADVLYYTPDRFNIEQTLLSLAECVVCLLWLGW